jgi:hypothetical protein
MTVQDYLHPSPHYYQHSIYPWEYGGGRRQKHARSPGLNIQPNEKLACTTRQFTAGSWVIGTAVADEKVFVIGCCAPMQADYSFGWVEQVDPVTLKRIRRSPDLKSGGHNWCGGGGFIASGHLLIGNGRYVQKLNLDLEVVGELQLPVDHAHNGLLMLSDGMAITRNLEYVRGKPSWFTVFDPQTMEVVERYEFVGDSIGRFSVDGKDDYDHIYATTSTHIHRLIYKDGRLSLDQNWSASYDLAGEDQGFAWCNVLGDDSVWFMDMGDNAVNRQIMSAYPVGTAPLKLLQREFILHRAPQRVFRVSTDNSDCMDVLTLFGDPKGQMNAAPLYVQDRHILVAFDTYNGKIGGWRYHGPGKFTLLWQAKIRNSNQMLYFPDTGEIIMDDVLDAMNVDAVVIDVETGAEKGRVGTGTFMPSAMIFGPGYGRDVYSGSGMTGALYRIYVAE